MEARGIQKTKRKKRKTQSHPMELFSRKPVNNNNSSNNNNNNNNNDWRRTCYVVALSVSPCLRRLACKSLKSNSQLFHHRMMHFQRSQLTSLNWEMNHNVAESVAIAFFSMSLLSNVPFQPAAFSSLSSSSSPTLLRRFSLLLLSSIPRSGSGRTVSILDRSNVPS